MAAKWKGAVMPTYVAFGKDFGVTVDAEPEEVAKKFSDVSPGQLVQFQGTQQQSVYPYFLNGGSAAYIVRVDPGSSESPS
jgi:hypothetical protein